VRVTLLQPGGALYAELMRFRHRMYCRELAWLDGDAEILTDEFDSVAFNYAAIEDGVVVGSVRVVPDSALGLPLEHCYSLDPFREPARRLVERARLMYATHV